MGSPFAGRDWLLSQFSIVTKALPPVFFSLVQSLRDGVTLFGSSLRSMLLHSIGTKSLSEPCAKFLRDVTLWVECGPRSTLDHE